MQPAEFGYLIGRLQKQAEDPGARTQALIAQMRAQGINNAHYADNGMGGFTQTRVNTKPPAVAGRGVATPVKPVAPAGPAPVVTKMKSRSAF